MIVGRKKRLLREQWLRWSHEVHQYKEADQCLENIAAGKGHNPRRVHTHDFPVYFCNKQPGLQPMAVHAEIEIELVRLTKLRHLGIDRWEVSNIMEWDLDHYDARISNNGTEVHFRSEDPDDPGNMVYIRSAVGSDLAFRMHVALGVRRDGLSEYRRALHDARLKHITMEPDRSGMKERDIRVQAGGQIPADLRREASEARHK